MRKTTNLMRVTMAVFIAVTMTLTVVMNAAAQPAPPAATTNPCPHGIDQEKCPFCDPSRIEQLGMCKEHATPEALCVKCKPYLKAAFVAAGDWCEEHHTPESQCVSCNPQGAKAIADRLLSAGVSPRWQRTPSPNCSTSKNVVRLASADIAEAAGLVFAEVKAAAAERVVQRNVELGYNANRYVRLSSRVPGVITEVLKDLGQPVRKGDPLVIVDSGELGSAKASLLQAMETAKLWQTNAGRERSLVEKGVGVEREALEAETKAAESQIEVNKTRQQLRNLGLSGEQLKAVEESGDTSPSLEIRAPLDGIVVERSAVLGEFADPARSLLAVADTTVMWAKVDLLEGDVAFVHVGSKASVRLDGLAGKTFSGTLTWISTQVDEKTRTVAARIELENSDGQLRAHMFGKAEIATGEARRSLAIPKEAVQWEGCCNVAFVKDDDKGLVFRPARLTLGFDAGDHYEVVDGVKPGEMIVTKGSFILKNEILRDSIGAGCCEVEHLKK